MKKPVNKLQLVYVYDPLCGWCYGFSNVMMKLKERFGDTLEIKVVSGGMVIGENVGPISNIAPYIQSAHKEVEKLSGVKFGEAFLKGTLEEGKMRFSSAPPSLALTVFKSFNDKDQMNFAHDIQNMIYYDGKDLNLIDSYTTLLKPYGIDEQAFIDRFNDTIYQRKTLDDFIMADKLKVSGFPSLFVNEDGKYRPITRGFETYDKVEKKLKNLLH